MSRRARRQAKQRKDLLGVVLSVVAVLVLVGFFVWGQRGSRELDSANCPEDGRYAAQIAILLDPSDTLTAAQGGSGAPRVLAAIENEAPETAEIRVFTVARAGRGDTTAVFRACKPQHPEGVSTLTGNPQIVERRYQEEFLGPLRRTVTALLDSPGDTVSPILEAIQIAAVSAFQPRDANTPRQLLIVSDMIQNSRDLSFYIDPVDFAALARNPDYGTLRVDLSEVAVSAFLLARRGDAGRIQAGGMRRFWEDYFIDQGADSNARPRWVNVEG